MNDLKKLFAPSSLAVIGASRREGSLGKMFLDAVVHMNFKGQLLPINPKAEEINGIQCYPDINALPDVPDLAVILLPKEMVLTTVDQLSAKGVKHVIVISAGFKETGPEGAQRERELLQRIRECKMRMVGPNSMGLFNTHPTISLNATFSPTIPLRGHVGFISQSGALGVAVLELAQQMNLGFSTFVSTGNKADIGDVDCLQFLKGDENTKVIIFYQEAIDHPHQFRKICKSIVSDKPILTLKAGRTGSGLRAASSHTGALAADDLLTDAFLRQSGVIRCDTLQELLDTARAFVNLKIPSGNKFVVVTNAGGPGILASDALEKEGIQLPSLSEKTIQKLKTFLPAEAGLQNPIDMIASATHETYLQACELLEKEKDIDGLFVVIVKPPVDTTADKIVKELQPLIKKSKKPFFLTIMACREQANDKQDHYSEKLNIFSYPESAARVAGHSIRYRQIQKRFKAGADSDKTDLRIYDIPAKQRQASFKEITGLLEKYNLPICDYLLTSHIEQVIDFFRKRKRIVLKIANEQILHKSDQNLVKLNLMSEDKIREAFEEIQKTAKAILPEHIKPLVLVQEFIPQGIELVLGTSRDPHYGQLIMFGIGGVLVELYRDVSFRQIPLQNEDILQMIDELKGKKLLEGFRQFPRMNKEILIAMIRDFSQLIVDNPYIVQMDLNPIIWSSEKNRPIIVDSRCTIDISKKG